jgi:hypothetical protein
MSKTLEQILGYVYLTGVIQRIQSGIPDVLPSAFNTVKKQILGNQGRYTQTFGTRKTSRRVEYGAPAVAQALLGIESKDVKLLHTLEMITMDPLLLQMLRSYDSYDLQKMGIDELNRQQLEFKQRFDNLRLSTVYSMLSNGAIYFDRLGNLLPTSSGAYVTVDYGINANNKNQLNGIISASWANANTDIPSQLRALKLRAAQLTGYPLKYAFYGKNIPSYLTQNNYVLDYLARNPPVAQKFLDQAELPDNLFGYTWVPVYTAFFEDADGTNQTFFGDDKVVFCPEVNTVTYELMEGSYQVPSSFNATQNMASALGSMKTVHGQFSYGVPVHNPPTVQMFFGDTFLPIWKIPDALFTADVTP